MKTRAFLLTLALVVVLVLSTFAWQRRTAPPTDRPARFTVVGVVTAPAVGRQVSVAHDDIPGLMPAMTMPFTMGTGVDVGALRPGDRVRFVLEVGTSRSEAHSLELTGRDEAMAIAAAGANQSAARASSRLRRGDAVPAFTLRDQDGAPFTEAALAGHFTVATFIFTRCPVPEFCPLMVQRFRALQTALQQAPVLGAGTRLLSITLDPAFDTPEVLHAYGTAMGADFARWSFVTGTPEAIDGVAKAFAVYRERNGAALDHTLATALIGPDGRVLEIWRGNGWKAEDVLAALPARQAS